MSTSSFHSLFFEMLLGGRAVNRTRENFPGCWERAELHGRRPRLCLLARGHSRACCHLRTGLTAPARLPGGPSRARARPPAPVPLTPNCFRERGTCGGLSPGPHHRGGGESKGAGHPQVTGHQKGDACRVSGVQEGPTGPAERHHLTQTPLSCAVAQLRGVSAVTLLCAHHHRHLQNSHRPAELKPCPR